MFWVFAAALTAMVALAILRPFWRDRAVATASPASYDLRVYRDQLAEVDRDLMRGIITSAEAERLRIEIGRKVLDADRALHREPNPEQAAVRKHSILAVLALAVLIGGGWLLYARIGAPSAPDMGLQSRFAAAEARYAARPSQAEAEARHAARNPVPAPKPSEEDAALMNQLREAVASRPGDLRGLEMLARNEALIGDPVAARKAQANLIEVKGKDATAAEYALLAGFMVDAAGGIITPEAEQEIAHALEIDPRNVHARYMTGLLQAQNGRPDRAFPVWAGVLEDAPADSPWAQAIAQVIDDVAWLAGVPDYVAPAARSLRGPDQDAVAAAADMTPEDRQAFIDSMVDQLSSRLANEGGSAEEWAQLIIALGVQGKREQASRIHAEARGVFASMPDALAMVDEAARSAGVMQ